MFGTGLCARLFHGQDQLPGKESILCSLVSFRGAGGQVLLHLNGARLAVSPYFQMFMLS